MSAFGLCIEMLTGRRPIAQLEESMLDDWFPRGQDGCRVIYAAKYDFFEILWVVPGVGEIELCPDGSLPEELPIPEVSGPEIADDVIIFEEENYPVGFSVGRASGILGSALVRVPR